MEQKTKTKPVKKPVKKLKKKLKLKQKDASPKAVKKKKFKKVKKVKKTKKPQKSCDTIISEYKDADKSALNFDINDENYMNLLKCMSDKERSQLGDEEEFNYLYPNKKLIKDSVWFRQTFKRECRATPKLLAPVL